MATYYLDTSALVKLYVPEPGSGWIEALLQERDDGGRPIHVAAISEIGIVEVAAAVGRREGQGDVAARLGDMLLERFAVDLRERFFTLAVRGDVVHQAAIVARSRGLRAYDAVHLATALLLEAQLRDAALAPSVFVSADRGLLAAARGEGLLTEDPAAHEG